MSLMQKVDEAVCLIKEEVGKAERPIVMSSFGKDSMVLLALVKMSGLRLPVLSFREPFFPSKYLFANSVILADGLTVYDYPPMETAVAVKDDTIEIINYHQAGEQTIYLPTGVKAPRDGEPALCGLNDLYLKPTCATYDFPWDLLLIGHKSSDVDPIFGPVPLLEKRRAGRPACIFPLADFTDDDIWAFTLAADLPINRLRYNSEDGWREHSDITFNPDYFPACTACIDPARGSTVYCPKVNEMVANLSGHVRTPPIGRPSYFAETVNA